MTKKEIEELQKAIFSAESLEQKEKLVRLLPIYLDIAAHKIYGIKAIPEKGIIVQATDGGIVFVPGRKNIN